jgi:tetratricopeptide (TPR) repeat protein
MNTSAALAGTGTDREHLSRLGLDASADAARIRAAHDALVAYLAAAPTSIRPWARVQEAEVNAAFRALEARSARPPRSATAAAASSRRAGADLALDGDDAEALLDALDDRTRPAPRVSVPHQSHRAARVADADHDVRRGAGLGAGRRRLGLTIGGLAIVAVAVVGIYKLGEPIVPGLTGSPAPAATQAAIDEAQVLALMQQLNANPKDTAVLRQLADLYYAGGDSTTSRKFLLELLAIEPDNVEALLGAGATAYNLDDFTAAEDAWQKVVALDPTNVDAQYDLGLMYFSMDPPDLVAMRQAWDKVIELAPDSQLASIVRTHMPDPTSSAGTSAAPASAAPSINPTSPVESTAPAAS